MKQPFLRYLFRVQDLHDRLSREHENLLTEHSSLKTALKDAKAKLKTLSEQNVALQREKETWSEVCWKKVFSLDIYSDLCQLLLACCLSVVHMMVNQSKPVTRRHGF